MKDKIIDIQEYRKNNSIVDHVLAKEDEDGKFIFEGEPFYNQCNSEVGQFVIIQTGNPKPRPMKRRELIIKLKESLREKARYK